jgi:hypothetical protein
MVILQSDSDQFAAGIAADLIFASLRLSGTGKLTNEIEAALAATSTDIPRNNPDLFPAIAADGHDIVSGSR